jgi:hypothetical protein
MPKRPRDKRISLLANEVAEATEASASAALLANRVDDSLFTIDVPAGKRPRSSAAAAVGVSSAELIASAMTAVSKVKFMQPKIAAPAAPASSAALKAHAAGNRKQQAKARLDGASVRARAPQSSAEPAAAADLWAAPSEGARELTEDEDLAVRLRPHVPLSAPAARAGGAAAAAKAPLARVLAAPAAPGSSYNPSVRDHQAALAVALDAETHASETSRRRLAALGEEGGVAETAGEARAAAARRLALVAASNRMIGEGEEEPEAEAEAEADQAMRGGGGPAASGRAAAAAAAAATAAAPAKVPKKKPSRAERIASSKAKRAAKAERAVAAFDAELAAAAKLPVAATLSKAARREAAAAAAAHATAAAATLLDVPLSEELTGSLRTMRPLTSGQLLLAAMPSLSRRGDVGRRARIPHVLARERADGSGPEIVRHSAGAVRASTGRKNPWKIYEFPRRRNHEASEDAVRDAMARGEVRGQVPGVTLNFAASQAAREKVAKEAKAAAAKVGKD